MADVTCMVKIVGSNINIHSSVKIGKNVKIVSDDIFIDEGTVIGDNTMIVAWEKLVIGKFCVIRPNAKIRVRSLEIGDFFFSDDNPRPLIIGGGGSNGPTAKIKIGKQCVIHDSYINVFMPVEIGDNVGLSPSSDIITHGFWNSILKGFNVKYGAVKIGSGCILGYRSLILPNVTLGNNVSVGAGAVVTSSFPDNVVIGGVPAKVISGSSDYPIKLSESEKEKIVCELMYGYAESLKDKVDSVSIVQNDDTILITGLYDGNQFFVSSCSEGILVKYYTEFIMYLDSETWEGNDNTISDDLRDYLRHYGIRIFSRRFKSIRNKIEVKLRNLNDRQK